MAAAALRQLRVALATGVDGGTVRFNRVNGLVLQRLLFKRALERKPVSMFWFRVLWPLVWQRPFVMSVVQPSGIYCFYSKRLIERLAISVHQPEVVICSWPPAGNPFERDVFKTRSVQLYVLIGSRHEFSSGNWTAYRAESGFEFVEDPALSRLVLPPELEAAVYVFRRKPAKTRSSDGA